MPDPMQCGTCRHFAPDEREAYADKNGYCRRFPPQIVPEMARDGWGDQITHIGQHSPYMTVGDWCGEWKADHER